MNCRHIAGPGTSCSPRSVSRQVLGAKGPLPRTSRPRRIATQWGRPPTGTRRPARFGFTRSRRASAGASIPRGTPTTSCWPATTRSWPIVPPGSRCSTSPTSPHHRWPGPSPPPTPRAWPSTVISRSSPTVTPASRSSTSRTRRVQSSPEATTLQEAHAVTVWGNIAFVADGDAGLVAIDVIDPATPTLAGSVATSTAARDVVVTGDAAFVAVAGGLDILNVTAPRS